MRKFLSGCLVGLVLTVLTLLVILFALGRAFSSKQTVVPGNAVLVMDLEGDIPEASPVEVPLPFFQSRAIPPIHNIWAALHEAASDKRVKAIVLSPRNLQVGWARLEELRSELIGFKKSGKPVYAYLQSPGTKEYYLATVADKLYVPPDDIVNVRGIRAETLFFKTALDRLGVGVQVDHMGKYKDAGDMFTRTDMTPETRQVLNEILDQIFGDFCNTVAFARHKTADDVRALVDRGPFVSEVAQKAGLVDQLGFEDQVYSDLRAKTGTKKLDKINIRAYATTVPDRGDKIALIVGEGEIFSGRGQNSFRAQDTITSGGMKSILERVRNDSSIKGVIFRVNSPGGDAMASDEILHEMRLLSKDKPVVISFSDVAASGGYLFSLTGDPIVAYPDTLTGSIGVLYVRPNIHDLLNKLGINEDTVSRGASADIDSLLVPLNPVEQVKWHDLIQSTYVSFVTKVAKARNMTYERAESLAQGRVWMGEQARANGLVNQLGGLDEAVALIRQRAKLSPDGETNLAVYPPKRTWIQVLTETSPESYADAKAEAKIRQVLPALPSRSLLHGGLLHVLPFTVDVH